MDPEMTFTNSPSRGQHSPESTLLETTLRYMRRESSSCSWERKTFTLRFLANFPLRAPDGPVGSANSNEEVPCGSANSKEEVPCASKWTRGCH